MHVSSLQICRWWRTRPADHNLQLSLRTSPSYQPSLLLGWSKPTAHIISHASVQGFGQSCSTEMVTHRVRADRWGWLGANDAKENSEPPFPTAVASSQTASGESVRALKHTRKKQTWDCGVAFFSLRFQNHSLCLQSGSVFLYMKQHNLLSGLACEKCRGI